MIGNQQIALQPGQFIFGRKKASKETRLSERSIRTCVYNLCTLGNLTIKTTNRFSLITIVNWELYQDKGIKTTSKTTNDRPATDHIQQCNNETKGICDSKKSPLSQEKKKEKSTRKETNPQVKEIIAYFFSTLKDMHEIQPVPVEASDAKLVKLALQKLDSKRVKDLIHWYISKGFLKDGSPDGDKYRLRLALSNFQINEFNEKGAWLYGY